MDLNRRSFLTRLGLGLAVAPVVAGAVASAEPIASEVTWGSTPGGAKEFPPVFVGYNQPTETEWPQVSYTIYYSPAIDNYVMNGTTTYCGDRFGSTIAVVSEDVYSNELAEDAITRAIYRSLPGSPYLPILHFPRPDERCFKAALVGPWTER